MAGALLAVTLGSAAEESWALESDQYYAWGRPLDDATAVLNAKVELEIGEALRDVNSHGSWRRIECPQVVNRIIPRFQKFIFQDIELWATNSSLVSRVPATADEELEYRSKYLYRNSPPWDVGTKVPPSPTIEINGIRLGTDKLSHFFSEGWWYYRRYRRYQASGLSNQEAEERVIRRGIWWERTILGLASSGVFSPGDLEANYQGLQFLIGLCDGDSPALQKTDLGWRYVGTFDLAAHVGPEWDESYQPPIFGRRRWQRVRPALLDYCPLLSDPAVQAQRERYQARDRVTPTELELKRQIDAGKIADPQRFSLDSNCAPPSSAEAGPRGRARRPARPPA